MAKIETGRFSELMRRLLSMSGVVEVAQELAPEISPVFVLESERPEWEFIKGGRLCSSQISTTAVVAEQATGRIRNPPNSGVIAVVSGFNVSGNTSAAVYLAARFTTTADLLNPTVVVNRDTRLPIQSSAIIASQAKVGIAIGADFFWHSIVLPNDHIFVNLPFVLTPGFALDLTQEATNLDFRGGVHWLERRIGELEVA